MKINSRVPSPPGANPLVAERAFPTSDYWGRTGVARCAEEMTQESAGMSNRLLNPCHTRLRRPPRGPFSYQGVSTRGVRHSPEIQGLPNGGVSNGGVSRSGLVLPFLSFFVLFGTFPIVLGFSRFARGWPGIFPIRPFSLSQPIKSTCEEESRKGPRHNLDLSRKKWETPRFGNPPV